MAMNALAGVIDCLETSRGEITVPEPTRAQALGCIERMLDFVATNPAATARPGLVPHIGAA
jgi:quinolinate synthase